MVKQRDKAAVASDLKQIYRPKSRERLSKRLRASPGSGNAGDLVGNHVRKES